MNDIISVKDLSKCISSKQILSNISFTAKAGEIIGIVGTNGAGKTTLLKSLLGLSRYKGCIETCGLNPKFNQRKLTEQVSFIADTATLPKWITISQLLEYMDEVHPNFCRQVAESFLDKTNISRSLKVEKMSKGMVTQVHLAMVIAIKSKLLVLDEPTLGLDIVRRKSFYHNLLEDYYDENNTVVITTHQIEEVEHILTRVIFIDQGSLVADISVDEIEQRYVQVKSSLENSQSLLDLKPIYHCQSLGGVSYTFDGVDKDKLTHLGKVSIPSLSDLFIAHCAGQSPLAPVANKKVGNMEGAHV